MPLHTLSPISGRVRKSRFSITSILLLCQLLLVAYFESAYIHACIGSAVLLLLLMEWGGGK